MYTECVCVCMMPHTWMAVKSTESLCPQVGVCFKARWCPPFSFPSHPLTASTSKLFNRNSPCVDKIKGLIFQSISAARLQSPAGELGFVIVSWARPVVWHYEQGFVHLQEFCIDQSTDSYSEWYRIAPQVHQYIVFYINFDYLPKKGNGHCLKYRASILFYKLHLLHFLPLCGGIFLKMVQRAGAWEKPCGCFVAIGAGCWAANKVLRDIPGKCPLSFYTTQYRVRLNTQAVAHLKYCLVTDWKSKKPIRELGGMKNQIHLWQTATERSERELLNQHISSINLKMIS